jgi:hypothetical protein
MVCNQQVRAYWTNLGGGHHNKPEYLQQLQNVVILVTEGAGTVDTTFFQHDTVEEIRQNK